MDEELYIGWSLEEMSNKFREGITTHSESLGVLGKLGNPTFNLPLVYDLYFSYGNGEVEFIRNSDGTYINRHGVLDYAGQDEARFEKAGILIEGASTNLVKHSTNLSIGTFWTTRNVSCTSVVDTGVKGPDGVLNAYKVSSSGTNDFTYSQILDTDTTYSNNASCSVFVKEGNTPEVQLVLFSNTAGADMGNIIYNFDTDTFSDVRGCTPRREFLANGWIKIELNNILGGNSTSTRLLLFPVSKNNLYTAGFTYFSSPQLEAQAYSTSYIPTSGTVANRAKETCDVTGLYNYPDMKAVSVTLEMTLKGYNNANNRILSLYGENEAEIGKLEVNRDNSIEVTRRSSTAFTFENTITPAGYFDLPIGTAKYGYVFDNDASSNIIFVNGVDYPASSNATADYQQPWAVSKISIGCQRDGLDDSSHLNGHVRNIKVYDSKLSQTAYKLS